MQKGNSSFLFLEVFTIILKNTTVKVTELFKYPVSPTKTYVITTNNNYLRVCGLSMAQQ